jgi:hypothetical protein|tara:strand:- start:2214 stop:2414 length:201 start_codon:yes stop_codon:yes gene_type:complete
MSEEVIRYGAGGAPYKGNVGPHSTEGPLDPEPTPEPVVKVAIKVEEDDTPLTDAQVVKKATGGKVK